MREEISNLVHPVIGYGLKLKERLDRGESPDLFTEQAQIKALMGSELQARRYADFGGDFGDAQALAEGRTIDPARSRTGEQFLGVRYALACWLDEMFILDSNLGQQWTERKIEEALYGTNDRAWRFWEQAQKAEARPGSDALEVYFLCVMLGFRGDLRENPDKLKNWVKASSAAIAKGQGAEWPMPPELEAPVNVPPLRGRERMQKMAMVGAVLIAILVPVVTFLVVLKLS